MDFFSRREGQITFLGIEHLYVFVSASVNSSAIVTDACEDNVDITKSKICVFLPLTILGIAAQVFLTQPTFESY